MSFVSVCLATQAIDGAIASRRDDPAFGARRRALRRPPLYRCLKRIRHGLLGEVDVAEGSYEHGDGTSIVLAKHAFDFDGESRCHPDASVDVQEGTHLDGQRRGSTESLRPLECRVE